MINTGAYSKKYQSIERERMREIKDREKKFSKERTLFLSIQTSQRQKAMEEKKRAMAEAEEERRRKALEDRRQSQQQATDRFRSVMGRIKNPTPVGRRYNFPAKSKATKCSFLHKKNMVSSPVEQREVRSQVKCSDTEIDQELVKMLPTTPLLETKSPSLDNVFDQGNETSPSNPGAQMSLLNRRSASETNLTQVKPLQLTGEYSDSTLSKENALFHPSIKTLPAPESRDSLLEITAVSPVEKEFCIANSPGVPDSLNSSPNVDLKEMPSQQNKEFSLSESCREQLKCSADESDTSNDDSLEETAHTSSSTLKFHTSNKQEPVVGILKKSKPSSIPPMNLYNPSRFNSYSSSKPHRKVRFSDQVDVNSRNTSPVIMNITDPVQIELWKRVFPKELSPQSVPNSAFTPKMKCSLSSKSSFQRPLKRNSTPSTANSVLENSIAPQKLGINNQVDIPESTHPTVSKTLDKTPTDAEINTMWDQIRQYLQDDKKVSIPPRVFNFKPPSSDNGTARRTLTRPVTLKTSMPMNKLPSNTKSFCSADPHRSNKHLVYRQPNLSKLRVHHNDSHPGPVTMLYSTPLQHEPVFKGPGQSKEPSNANVLDLSLEEEKLMHSIERINQKLKDHLDAPLLRTQYYYPTPPPKKTSDQTHSAARPRVVSEFNRTKMDTFGDNHSSVLHHKHSSHVT